jgi:hypothetical protein
MRKSSVISCQWPEKAEIRKSKLENRGEFRISFFVFR